MKLNDKNTVTDKDRKDNKLLIENVKLWSQDGFTTVDLYIKEGKIEEIKSKDKKHEIIPEDKKLEKELKEEPDDINYSSDFFTGDKVTRIDGKGCIAMPSLIDLHVHFREPGYSYKETIKTGSEAAAAGGFTTVCTMPNLSPAPDSMENLKKQTDIIEKDACVEVIPFATITKLRMGNELVDYKGLAPYVAGFSDDGSGVQSEEVMKSAMEGISETGKILAAHCEVNTLLKGGYIHDGEYCKEKGHKGICSESEWKEVERDIRLAKETGCRLHICHVSTKESVELVRKAKAEGVKVTCETGPHYLTFADNSLKEDGRFKMNPPIRGKEDREALRLGVIDGTIDIIATDHAPHSLGEKSKGLEKSAMGVVGLETAFAAVYTTMVDSGLMPLSRLIEAMAITPRKILGHEGGEIKKGEDANLILVDLNEEFEVNPDEFKTKGRATPYAGEKLKGKIKTTIYNGIPVYNLL